VVRWVGRYDGRASYLGYYEAEYFLTEIRFRHFAKVDNL
jgi:hypothetical protein